VKNEKQLHVVSTGRQSDERLVEIAKDIHPYITALHIREKAKTAKELTGLINQLAGAGVPLSKLIVNDRADVALGCQTRGVQLAYHSLDVSLVRAAFPNMMIGCSVHSVKEAQYAEQNGADYLLYGHIFETGSKADEEPRGLVKLQRLREQASIPVIAIGGIKPSNVQDVIKADASGIAVLSGILESDSPLEAVKDYHNQLEVWNGLKI
jgi:thiazole tautomerase (transcriptional regulator TenI)